LVTGEDVAIKIQYNKVKESISSDILNLGLLMKLPGLMPKGMYIERVLKKT
jgi:predicted unusual protein kinase regulating ubiquinone biosynthesis (AarF/ABC1/UbiB family)